MRQLCFGATRCSVFRLFTMHFSYRLSFSRQVGCCATPSIGPPAIELLAVKQAMKTILCDGFNSFFYF